MPDIAYLNGEFMPISEAKVSIDDRGYQFGDGVYEVVQAYSGILWTLDQHLKRLERSLKEVAIKGVSITEVRQKVIETYKRSQFENALIYFQITRGVSPRQHAFPTNIKPTFLITIREQRPIPEEFWENGVITISHPEIRWTRRDIKSINLLPNVLAKQKAHESGAYEAIFVEKDGTVTEGSSTNVFAIKDGALITTPDGFQILPGITKMVVFQLATDNGVKVIERNLAIDELKNADEAFLCGTTTEIAGIIKIDDNLIGSGRVGALTRRLHKLYRELIAIEGGRRKAE